MKPAESCVRPLEGRGRPYGINRRNDHVEVRRQRGRSGQAFLELFSRRGSQ
jgi:hypothetical protein